MLKDADDIESLRLILRKLRKADDTLLYPQTIWKLGYESFLQVLANGLDYNAAWDRLFQLESSTDFTKRAPEFEKFTFTAAEPRPVLHQGVIAAVQIRKLNESDENEDEVS
jgi:hypothetical protein